MAEINYKTFSLFTKLIVRIEWFKNYEYLIAKFKFIFVIPSLSLSLRLLGRPARILLGIHHFLINQSIKSVSENIVVILCGKFEFVKLLINIQSHKTVRSQFMLYYICRRHWREFFYPYKLLKSDIKNRNSILFLRNIEKSIFFILSSDSNIMDRTQSFKFIFFFSLDSDRPVRRESSYDPQMI